MEIVEFILPKLMVVLGIGLIIFVHELGHFLAAKWYGVRCEVFSIGFGPPLLRYKPGETEYRLAALPLGGYVLMTGQDFENVADAQSQTESSSEVDQPTSAGQDEPPPKNDPAQDPRSFANKSVGARMVIMSAGVVMNVIFGYLGLVIIEMYPSLVRPAVVGTVIPGRPAYESGLEAGDTFLTINGQSYVDYSDLSRAANLSSRDEPIEATIERLGFGEPIEVTVQPVRQGDKAKVPTIGVTSSDWLILGGSSGYPYLPPAGAVDPPADPRGLFPETASKIVSLAVAGGEPIPIANPLDLTRLLAQYRDQPVDLILKPLATEELSAELMLEEDPSGLAMPASNPDQGSEIVTIPPSRFVDPGFRTALGPVVSLRPGYPAIRAGVEVGDRIVAVDGDANYDPWRLPSLCYDRARAGESILLTIERTGESEPLELELTPNETPPWSLPVYPTEQEVQRRFKEYRNDPMDVSGLGLCCYLLPEITQVFADSPADRAGLQPGDVLTSLTLEAPNFDPETAPSEWTKRPLSIQIEPEFSGVVNGLSVLQFLPETELTVGIEGRDKVTLKPVPVNDWWMTQRGIQLDQRLQALPGLSFQEACITAFWGTGERILAIYRILKGMFNQDISVAGVSGPIGITSAALDSAEAGWLSLLDFLVLISINLAIINFLPIPPLDGGRMIFLIGEKVRGRPLPDAVINAGLYLGIAFVLCLFALAFYQDIFRELSRFFDL